MDEESNTKYYVGGAILLLLLLWSKKSSAKPQSQTSLPPLQKNILDNLPNHNSFGAMFSPMPEKYVREIFNQSGETMIIPGDQNGPVIDCMVQLPDANTVYALRLGAVKLPENAFFKSMEELLAFAPGLDFGGVDAGIGVGGKPKKFGATATFLGIHSPGTYIVSLKVKPEQRKLSNGRVEAISLTQEEIDRIPTSYSLVVVPQLGAA